MTISIIAGTISGISVILGAISALIQAIRRMQRKIEKINEGTRCLLRSEMLRIYYHNIETGEMRQYEYENFVALYDAYKNLDGNSFVDKIKSEVDKLKIIT